MIRSKCMYLLTVCIVVLLSTLAACGNTSNQQQAQGKVTIEYWNINNQSLGGAGVQELIKNFEKAHPDITVQSHYQSDQYAGLIQKMQAAIAAGNPPDIAQIGYNYIGYVTSTLPYQPIDDLARAYGASDWLTRYPPNILKLAQVGGKQAGMPYSLSDLVVYYNADLFKKAQLDPDRPPQTWDEWQVAAEKLKAVTNGPPLYLQLTDDNFVAQSLVNSTRVSCRLCQIR